MASSKDIRNEFAALVKAGIKSAYSEGVDDVQFLNTIKNENTAESDISSSVSFMLARKLKKNPQEIATHIASKCKTGKLIEKITSTSGYLNAKIKRTEYSKQVIDEIRSEKDSYGSNESGKGMSVLVESPSVNPNKPWHIGHLRNALLGDSISNILEACAFDVEREDYIDDLGLQVAESLWGYMNLKNKPDKKFDQWLGEQYVIVNKKMSEDKEIAEKVKHLITKMESKGTKESKLLKEISEKCLMAQYETSFDYGIYHDLLIWESSIVEKKLLEKALAIAEKKGILERPKEGKYANCVTIKLDKVKELAKDFENPMEDTKVLVRSNGTATYAAKDFAFHMWKFGLLGELFEYDTFIEKQPNGKPLYTTAESGKKMEFGSVEKVVNIIGSKQRYEQLIIKALFSMMGEKEMADNIIHVSYGEVSLSEGSLSGRTGGWMGSDGRAYTADSLLSTVTEKAEKIVSESNKITDKGKIGEISKAVALSAIKFDFLRISPERAVTFSWETALKFEGNTGPYCMYTYARATRLLEKAEYSGSDLKAGDYKEVGDSEFALVKIIGNAQEVVEKAGREYRPNVITDYLLELAAAFSKFYESTPVIEGGDAKAVRLELVSATRQTIGNMLLLLGIRPIERM